MGYFSPQPYESGTAGYTHVHEIVSNLRNLGVSIKLFVPNYRTPTRSKVTRAWKILALQAHFVWWLITHPRIDVLYTRHHYAVLPLTIAGKLLRIPVVTEVNGPLEDFLTTWTFPRWLQPLIVRAAIWQCQLSTMLIAVTPGLASSLTTTYGVQNHRVLHIPNGVNVSIFIPTKFPNLTQWPQLEDSDYVLFIGALSPWQSIDTMIEAARGVSWPNEVRLVLAGDGPLRPLVEASTGRNLIYLGPVEYEHVPQLIGGSFAGLCLISDPSRAAIGVSPPQAL